MISYFKANDPYRLVGVFLILLVIRGIMFLFGVPLLLPEIKWMIIGEKLGSGALMYRDLWDFTPPMAAFVYKWLFIIFGKSRVPYYIFSILLVIFQAGIFNTMLLNNKAYSQNTYIPALVYVICMNLFVDFLTLPPVLMSMTFVLLALNNLFKRMDNTTRDELFVFTGAYLGLATLFFLPIILCLGVTVLALALYTGSILRRMLLLVYAYAVVMAMTSLVYYWQDAGVEYHSFFFGALWNISAYHFMDFSEIWIAALVPILVLILSLVKIVQYGRYINFQMRIQYVMFFFIIAGLVMMVMIKEISTYQLIYFVPFISFFITHYLLTIRHWILVEATAVLLFGSLLVNYAMTKDGWLIYKELTGYDKVWATEIPEDSLISDKRILVLSDNNLNRLKNSTLATPFLDWQLSQNVLENQNYYDNNARVYQSFIRDMPEVVVDQKSVMQDIFYRLPEIADQYSVHPRRKGVYVKN